VALETVRRSEQALDGLNATFKNGNLMVKDTKKFQKELSQQVPRLHFLHLQVLELLADNAVSEALMTEGAPVALRKQLPDPKSCRYLSAQSLESLVLSR
jgi:hypothetical protein